MLILEPIIEAAQLGRDTFGPKGEELDSPAKISGDVHLAARRK